jgi:hypothetical protein
MDNLYNDNGHQIYEYMKSSVMVPVTKVAEHKK